MAYARRRSTRSRTYRAATRRRSTSARRYSTVRRTAVRRRAPARSARRSSRARSVQQTVRLVVVTEPATQAARPLSQVLGVTPETVKPKRARQGGGQ